MKALLKTSSEINLNSFLSCSIKNLTLASVSRLFTIISDVVFPFYKF